MDDLAGALQHPDRDVAVARCRTSLGWLMLAIALIGFHLAVVCSPTPPLGLGNLEVGLLPSVTVLAISLTDTSTSGRRGGQGPSFFKGFVASLAVAACISFVCCLATLELVRRPVVYYINEIGPSLHDTDLGVVYRIGLEVQGPVLGLPQLLVALPGGMTVPGLARARRHAAVAPGRRSA